MELNDRQRFLQQYGSGRRQETASGSTVQRTPVTGAGEQERFLQQYKPKSINTPEQEKSPTPLSDRVSQSLKARKPAVTNAETSSPAPIPSSVPSAPLPNSKKPDTAQKTSPVLPSSAPKAGIGERNTYEVQQELDGLLGQYTVLSQRGGAIMQDGTPEEKSEWVHQVGTMMEQIRGLQDELAAMKEEERQYLIENEGYRDANLLDLTIGSIKKGYYNSRLGQESYKAMLGQENEKEKYEEILAGDEYKFLTSLDPTLGTLQEGLSGGAGLLGQQARQMTDPTSLGLGLSAAAAAALAGQVGPQVALPEEIVTVPGAFFKGLRVGSAMSNFQIEAGFAYNEMIENGISEPTARTIALAVGAGNAALEFVQADELFKSFQVLKKSGATQTVAQQIGQELLERGIDVGNEVLQEVAQEGVTIAGAQAANKLEKGEWAYDRQEVMDRLGETALSSALSFGVTNVPSAGLHINQIFQENGISNRAVEQVLADQKAIAELERTAGLKITEDMSKAQKRTAVKEAVGRLADDLATAPERRAVTGDRAEGEIKATVPEWENRQAFANLKERDTSDVPPAWAEKQVEEFTETLGKAGKTVFQQMFDPETEATEIYLSTMTEFYNAGRDGTDMAQAYERVNGESGGTGGFPLTAEQAQAAYLAGQADKENAAAVDPATVEMYNQETEEPILKEDESYGKEGIYLREGGQRVDRTDPGGQVRELEGRAGQNQGGTVQGRPKDSGAAALSYGEEVTTASLGIGGGSTSDRIHLVTGGDTEATASARKIAKERGLRLTLFVGDNLTIKRGGAKASVRGYVTGDRVFIRADHPDFTADQIMRHESGHDMISKGEIDPGTVRERIQSELGAEKTEQLAGMYESAYRGSGLTADEVWDEVVCDSLGDMNIFSGTVHEGAAKELLEPTKKAASAEQEARRNKGPPTAAEGKQSIEFDKRNKPYVIIEEDILSGMPKSEWIKTVKDNLREKFPDGVTVGRNVIAIDKQSRREMTFSKYMQRLMRTDKTLFADKLRATNNADEILQAAQNWVNEALLHPRKDDIIDFSRGDVLLRIGSNDYTAEVIVGSRGKSGLLLYDIINLAPTSIQERTKKVDAAYTDMAQKERHGRQATPTDISISETGENVNGKLSQDLKNVEALKKENRALKARVEYWKGQNKLTTEQTPDSDSTRALARELVGRWQSGVKPADITGDLEAVWKGLKKEKVTIERLKELAEPAARKLVETSTAEAPGLWQDYRDAAEYLRTVKLRITPELAGELDGRGGYGAFRKSNFGRLKLSSKAGLPIDTAYMELSRQYPGLFDPGAHDNVADMLFHMEEVAAQLVPVYENPYGYDINSAVEAAENEIVSAVMEGKIPEARGTMADRLKQRYLEAREEDVKRITAKANEKYTRYRESRALTEAKAELEKTWKQLAQKVLKPTDKKHVPEAMRAAIAEVLENINLESGFDLELGRDAMYHRTEKGRGEPTGRTEAFRALKKELTRMSEAGTAVVDPDLMGEDGYLEAVIDLKDKPISKMTSVDVRLINRVLREVSAAAENANRLFAGKRWKTVSEAAEELRRDNKGKREQRNYGGLAGSAQTLIGLDMLTPEAYFHRLGRGGDALFQSLRKAQDKQITLLARAAEATEALTKEYDVRKAERTLHKVTLGGKETELSTAQIMELYLLMGRKQAMDHIATGGMRPEGAMKGKRKLEQAEPYRGITVGELADAVDKLSEEDLKVADGLREFVSGELAEAGNEASLAVYDIRKFEEKRYWPIRVAGNELVQSPEDRSKSRVTTPANYGMTKQTKPDAKQSVRLGSVFDTFSRHVTEMSTYAAFLGAMEDLNRIRNYQFSVLNDNGTRTKTGNMGDIVNRVLGPGGTGYLDKLMEDLSLGISKRGGDRYGAGMIGHFKAAAVGGNLQVVIQQPTAILRACEQINPAYLAGGLGAWKSGWKKALKYAPIAKWKDWGYFDINTGRQIKSVLFDTESRLDKFENVMMAPAGAADSFAWGQLWSAVELETKDKRKDLTPGSEEYYAHVAERFSEIIDHSQVVDGILQRSQIMRNNDSMSKMATSFMAEPMKQINQLMSAVYDAIHEQESKARGKAMKQMVRTGIVLALGVVANALAKSVIGASRRASRDRDKKYWERYLAVLGENMLDGFNPLGYFPFVRDAWSIIQGYDVARMDTEVIADLVNAAKAVGKAAEGEGTKSLTSAGLDLVSALAAMTGVPAGNLKRELDGIINTFAVETDNYLLEYELEKFSYQLKDGKRYNDILWRALEKDEEQYRLLLEKMVRDGLDEEKLISDMTSRAVDALWKVYRDKKAYGELYTKYLGLGLDNGKLRAGIENKMKKAQGVTSSADLEQRALAPTEQESYNSTMGRIQRTDVWRAATAEQRDKLEDSLYDLTVLNKAGAKLQEKIDGGAAFGLDETDYLLYQLALSMVDQPTESGKMGTYTNDEVEEAIRMLTGLSDDARGYLWEAQGKSEKSNPWG